MRPHASARGSGAASGRGVAGRSALAVLWVLGVLATLATFWALPACSVPTDAEFFPLDPAQDLPFNVTAVALPQPKDLPQPVNPTITLTLSDFPDPATAQFPAVQLGLRGQPIEFLLELSLASKQLVLRPRRQLLPENDYFVTLTREVQALSGRALDPPLALRFRTGSFVAPAPVPEADVDLGQLLGGPAGLGARCAFAGCHGSAGGASPAQGLALDLGAAQLASYLTTTRARGSFEGLLLVQPGAPERSYLLRKLIAASGFARITGAAMPPPAAGPPLEPLLLHAVELWISQGAH